MTEKDIIQHIADVSQIPKTKVQAVVNGTTDAIAQALAHGDSVQITGFGTFTTRTHAARIGYSPKTGTKIQIAAGKSVGFHADKNLKDCVNP